MKMIRKPTYAGNAKNKDQLDIFYWAFQKTPVERLSESWRLHCLNNNVEYNIKLNKKAAKASLRNEQ